MEGIILTDIKLPSRFCENHSCSNSVAYIGCLKNRESKTNDSKLHLRAFPLFKYKTRKDLRSIKVELHVLPYMVSHSQSRKFASDRIIFFLKLRLIMLLDKVFN